MRKIRLVISAAALLLAASPALAATIVVSGVNQYGQHFTVHYRSDGSASGTCSDCRAPYKSDVGVWSRRGDSLCVTWRRWRGSGSCDVRLVNGSWRYQP